MSERSKDETEQRRDHHWKNEGGDNPPKPDSPPLAEWIVAAIGFVLVAGTIGFLIYQAVKGNSLPPDIVVEVDSITPVGSGYLVTFRAVNQGDSTAEGVIIEGTLKRGENGVETSETDLNYIPSRSQVKGGIFFTIDPRQFELRLRPHGYEQP